jgi:hypothetical protein
MARESEETKQLYEWAVAWLETGDIYYRDLLRNAVETPPHKESRFRAVIRVSLIEFPQDAYYANLFHDMVAEFKANPRMLG